MGPDVLMLSVGGNDVGYAEILERLQRGETEVRIVTILFSLMIITTPRIDTTQLCWESFAVSRLAILLCLIAIDSTEGSYAEARTFTGIRFAINFIMINAVIYYLCVRILDIDFGTIMINSSHIRFSFHSISISLAMNEEKLMRAVLICIMWVILFHLTFLFRSMLSSIRCTKR